MVSRQLSLYLTVKLKKINNEQSDLCTDLVATIACVLQFYLYPSPA